MGGANDSREHRAKVEDALRKALEGEHYELFSDYLARMVEEGADKASLKEWTVVECLRALLKHTAKLNMEEIELKLTGLDLAVECILSTSTSTTEVFFVKTQELWGTAGIEAEKVRSGQGPVPVAKHTANSLC